MTAPLVCSAEGCGRARRGRLESSLAEGLGEGGLAKGLGAYRAEASSARRKKAGRYA